MLISPLSLIAAADLSLGKIPDKSSLSQQTLMELFIEGIQNRSPLFSSLEHPPSAELWDGIQSDSDGTVTRITWVGLLLQGSVKFMWLPMTTQSVRIIECGLTGSADLTCLPGSITYVDLSSNAFVGSADLTCLPEKLETLHLTNNQMSGTVDLTHLPDSLITLVLQKNRFSGVADFSKLPSKMLWLSVEHTDITGVIKKDDYPCIRFIGTNNSGVRQL
uniref:Leucine-rich repeat protein n=1 Tax=Paramoeba aestuarina TaxID=180227 RepID=A0A7S4NI08_9EUKA|mmetsp:Transcript_16789/g.26126  ORF Transcript_16789/g.26126 Transcript_16789/m.26126 type:complete len:219 (+) Transcript_16789:36-692(+)